MAEVGEVEAAFGQPVEAEVAALAGGQILAFPLAARPTSLELSNRLLTLFIDSVGKSKLQSFMITTEDKHITWGFFARNFKNSKSRIFLKLRTFYSKTQG